MQPHVLLINMDIFGDSERGCYGGGVIRGAPTLRIHRLGAQCLRLNNFKVEAQCTPSHAALMTGRYAVRTATPRQPSTTRLPPRLDALPQARVSSFL